MSSSPPAERLEAAPTLELGHDPDGTAAPAPRSRPRWLSPGSWTLRSKLVASMLVLFTVVSVVTGAATVLFLRQVLIGQVDQTLQNSITRFRSIEPQTPGRGGPGDQGLQAYISTDGTFASRGTTSGKDPGSGAVRL